MSGRMASHVNAPNPAHDAVIARALRIMEARLQSRDVTLTSPQAVRDYLKLRVADREHEIFVVMFLDSQHRLIAAEELFRGTLAQTSVYPREVVKAALKHNAAAVIFAHNHPSGVAEPSRADEMLTQALNVRWPVTFKSSCRAFLGRPRSCILSQQGPRPAIVRRPSES